MERIKQVGIVVIVSWLLLNGAGLPTTWAQSVQPAKEEPSDGLAVAAVVTNVFYLPGKVAVCSISAGLSVVVMTLTLGADYKDVASVVTDGCGGKWSVKSKDLLWGGPGYWGPGWWGPSYYYPYSAPPVIVQRAPAYWYYCQNPQGYYPYIQQCPNGWMQVVPPASPPR
jgi:hypothetical protein